MTWTPVYCFATVTIIFVISEYLSAKTKGYVSFLVFSSILFAAGFWSGLLPANLITSTGISGILSVLIVPLLITNMGATIHINQMLKEWKTVVISLAGLAGITVLCCTIGTVVFGRIYAYSAVGPIAGGLVAAQMVQEMAEEVGNGYVGAFVMVVVAAQSMFGMPIATWCIKHDVSKKLRDKTLEAENKAESKLHIKEVKVFPDTPAKYNTSQMYFAKLAIAASLGTFIGAVTGIPAAICYLVSGCLLFALNFLPESPLGKAGAYGFAMVCMMTLAPTSFASLSPSDFMTMIVPIIGLLILGVIGIVVCSVPAGKALHYSPAISIAIGVTALLGYPTTQIIAEEAVNSLECSEEDKREALKYVLPKMLVGGFTTVTVASVMLTSIIAPMIFK